MPWYDWFPYEPNKPTSPQYGPYTVKLEANKKYMWCSCGSSNTQPWCNDNCEVKPGFRPVPFVPRNNAIYQLCGCKHGEYAPLCDGGTHKWVRAHNNPRQAYLAIFGGMFAFGLTSSWLFHP